ncbi:hypothetical protein ACTFIY_011255 [Dictyostelium cf. discoideum]
MDSTNFLPVYYQIEKTFLQVISVSLSNRAIDKNCNKTFKDQVPFSYNFKTTIPPMFEKETLRLSQNEHTTFEIGWWLIYNNGHLNSSLNAINGFYYNLTKKK